MTTKTLLLLTAVQSIFVFHHAQAADLQPSAAAAELSVRQGFSQSALPLLKRAAGLDAHAVAQALVQKICVDPCSSATTETDQKALAIQGDHWSIEVAADGSAARFHDQSIEQKAHSLAVDPSSKMSDAALQKIGLAFIGSQLKDVVALGPNEQLVPLRTDFRSEWGQDLTTSQVTRSVVANRVVFGRTINGTPIVGNGSRVVVTFANDGSVESYQYDWPKYEVTTTVHAVLDSTQVLGRVQRVVGARSGVAMSSFAAPILNHSGAAAYPVALSTSTSLENLQCGYYDAGSAANSAQSAIQAGCVYHATELGQNGVRRGFGGAVPAASTIESDANWTEVKLLQSAATPQPQFAPKTAAAQ